MYLQESRLQLSGSLFAPLVLDISSECFIALENVRDARLGLIVPIRWSDRPSERRHPTEEGEAEEV